MKTLERFVWQPGDVEWGAHGSKDFTERLHPRDAEGRFTDSFGGIAGSVDQQELSAWVNGVPDASTFAEMRRAIAEAPVTTQTVYRGMGRRWSDDAEGYDRLFDSLQVGAEFTLRPSSFSSNRDTALSAATGEWDGSLKPGDIVFGVSPGARAVDVAAAGGYRQDDSMFSGQSEYVSGGRFSVTEVSYDQGAKIVRIKQTGVWA